MDTAQSGPSFDESVARIMRTLPPAIRSYLSQGRHTPVAKSLMAKYGLRVDQGGILEREIILLLMGVENPEEFTRSLVQEANLGQETIAGIVRDVNAQIFAPLREEMRHPTPAPAPAKPAPQVYAPPPQSPAYVRPETAPPAAPSAPTLNTGRIPSRIAPLPPKTVLPRPSIAFGDGGPRPSIAFGDGGPRPAVASGEGGPRWQSQTLPTPPSQRLRLEDHEEPHIEFNKVAPPAPPRPSIAFGDGGPRPATVSGEGGLRPAPPSSKPVIAPVRPYSADPYREPIEEDSRK